MPRVVACGGRAEAYKNFCAALRRTPRSVVLLIDSEGRVATSDPWMHLAEQDHWTRPPEAPDDGVHMMVQCMETWFLADMDAVSRYFGRGFDRKSLPQRQDIEAIPKDDVLNALTRATRRCGKAKQYRKGRHSFAVLGALDPSRVADASPYARRLLDHLCRR